MNIVLIGMRGSGKSTIGARLSSELLLPLVETDKLIEEKNQKSISEIVNDFGWEYFRACEKEAIADCTQMDSVIISGGGGVILSQENRMQLKKNGLLIYLKVSPEILAKRIGNDSTRPFLTNAKTRIEDIRETFSERSKLYEESAAFIIEADQKSVDQICSEIKTFLDEKQIL